MPWAPLRGSAVVSAWGTTPKASIATEVARSGRNEMVRRCVALLQEGLVDEDLLFVLAGPAARQVLEGREGGAGGYWPRVWALRGLLHVWDDTATEAVVGAMADDAWRVREMAAKVVRAHMVDDALEPLGRLLEDPVPRVRSAADKARITLTNTRG